MSLVTPKLGDRVVGRLHTVGVLEILALNDIFIPSRNYIQARFYETNTELPKKKDKLQKKRISYVHNGYDP